MADTPKSDLGFGPSMLPVTKLPANVAPAFSSGPDIGRVDTGKNVAYAIRVRADLKVGDREFSGDVCMHEVVMLRRFYEDLGSGSVRLSPEWPPAYQRLVPMTQEMLQKELDRILSNFIIPRPNSIHVVAHAYLGTEPAEQLRRLHEVMRKQMEEWSKTVDLALARLPATAPTNPHWRLVAAFEAITSKELEAIANIADPARSGNDGIELPEVLAPTSRMDGALATAKPVIVKDEPAAQLTPEAAMKMVEVEESADDDAAVLVQRLIDKAGLDQQQALSVAACAQLAGDDIPDEAIAEAIQSKAKTKIDAVRRALKG